MDSDEGTCTCFGCSLECAIEVRVRPRTSRGSSCSFKAGAAASYSFTAMTDPDVSAPSLAFHRIATPIVSAVPP